LQDKEFKILINELDKLKPRRRTDYGAGSYRHCGSHWSVASSMGPNQ